MNVYGFYVAINLGCVGILLLLYYSIKKIPTPQLKYELFQKMILWHIAYFVNDSLWALVNDSVIPKNIFTVLTVNYLNAAILPMVAYSCFFYAEIGMRSNMTRVQIERLQAKLRLPIFLQTGTLLVSFVVAPDFWLNDSLEPCDFYYFILAAMPLAYLIIATIRGILHAFEPRNRPNIQTYLVAASYTPGAMIAGVAQILFALTTPIFCYWCTFIILFVYLYMQNQLISTDSLTMLNNRNSLHRYLRQLRAEGNTYVIMVDVDHFKQINDTYGHAEGDRALVLVSRALKNACDRLGFSIFLCRYGGDEFLMVAQTNDPDNVIKMIDTCLQEEIQKTSETGSYNIEVSMGYARWDGNPDSFKESLVKADQKMYEDKRLA